ncbi:hypothetical protein ABTY96_02050 [Streptomyces sp. NPDC096057]|uniref:hypothetical protein n=1 Tax=Streptomyces sp. NPDC096057 TaxID=3155543 RepID=UPI00331AB09F
MTRVVGSVVLVGFGVQYRPVRLDRACHTGAVYDVGYHGLSVRCVGRLRTLLSRAGVRRRLEQVPGGVPLLLGVRMAPGGLTP